MTKNSKKLTHAQGTQVFRGRRGASTSREGQTLKWRKSQIQINISPASF